MSPPLGPGKAPKAAAITAWYHWTLLSRPIYLPLIEEHQRLIRDEEFESTDSEATSSVYDGNTEEELPSEIQRVDG